MTLRTHSWFTQCCKPCSACVYFLVTRRLRAAAADATRILCNTQSMLVDRLPMGQVSAAMVALHAAQTERRAQAGLLDVRQLPRSCVL